MCNDRKVSLFPLIIHVTIAYISHFSSEVFDAFLGSERSDALLHGHSYTANPLTCAAALEAVRQMQNSTLFAQGRVSNAFEEEVQHFSLLPGVRTAMTLGSVLAVELDGVDDERAVQAAAEVVSLLKADRVYAR